MTFSRTSLTLGLLATAALSQAFDLTYNWKGGHGLFHDYGDGDTITMTDPVHIDSQGAAADLLSPLLKELDPGATVARGNDVQGTFQADTFVPVRILRAEGYAYGSVFTGRLLSNEDLRNTFWVVVISEELNHSGSPTAHFQYHVFGSDVKPHFYGSTEDFKHRRGTDGFGYFDYMYDTLTVTETGPVPYDMETTWSVFLVGDATPAGAARQFTIRDGLSYGVNWQARAVPEPGTLAALGLGAATLLRRRKRS